MGAAGSIASAHVLRGRSETRHPPADADQVRLWSIAIGGFTGRLFYIQSVCEVNDPAPLYYIVPNQTFAPHMEIGGRNKLLAPEHNYGHQSSHPVYHLSVSIRCDAYRTLALRDSAKSGAQNPNGESGECEVRDPRRNNRRVISRISTEIEIRHSVTLPSAPAFYSVNTNPSQLRNSAILTTAAT